MDNLLRLRMYMHRKIEQGLNESPYPETAGARNISQNEFDAFFAAGALRVYSTSPTPWRWLICAGQKSLQATVIDTDSILEKNASPVAAFEKDCLDTEGATQEKKPFEQSTLVQWLTRATHKQQVPDTLYSTLAENEDIEAFLKIVHFSRAEWDALNALPSLTAAEIRHFEQSHNAALSDIESAFLPARIDLHTVLANFYISHLVRARKDTEAALFIAQATHSTRLPRLMADALAVGAFEGAGDTPLHHEGHDYASTCVQDTAAYIDAALAIAAQKLAYPIDHDGHLLRLNIMDVSRLASEIVESHKPSPASFLLKARELYTSRCDVCRFPPLIRLATAINENDVRMDESWAHRMALAYERLFEGRAAQPEAYAAHKKEGKVVAFSR